MIKKIAFILCISTAGVFLNGAVLTSDQVMKEAQKSVKSINTKQLLQILKKDPNTQIFDLRTRGEILKSGGYIKANRITNIQRGVLEFTIADEVKENETFIVHCNNGNRSLLAAKTLKDMGYKNVIHYKDSYKGWEKAGLKTSSLDRYLESMLYRKIEKVAEGVYTSIGQTSPGSYENSGHNNNLGFVVGNDSVLVWNASSTYLLARAFHEEIKKITNKPVKYVVLENSQGHAMLGSNYWKEQGAHIVAQEIAKQEIIDKGEGIYKRYANRQKDKILGTKVILPDETFKDKRVFDLGGRVVEALYFGYAHEHSDICIWLPKEKIVFAGDLAFNQRLLPIFKITETKKWLEAWDKFAALKAKIVVPGHGDTTDMPTVTKYTKDYLVYLRAKITEIVDNDGDLNEAYEIDMSDYQHLDTFKELGKQNIARLFGQMEFEE